MDNFYRVVNYINYVLDLNTPDQNMSTPSTSSGCVSGLSEDSDAEKRSVLSVKTYLTSPEDLSVMSSREDLENAIKQCKSMVLEKMEETEEQKWLVRRLIELRLRLEEVKEMAELGNANETNRVLLGHHFALQNHPSSTAKHYCDRCSGLIWNVIHSWYLCADCEYKTHIRCLSQVCRVCAHLEVSERPTYIMDVCPEAEDGLASQNYRCAECLTHTSFSDGVLQPRLCDYNGQYYCPTCHWNSSSVIPARVINNWDFQEKKVCRSSKQILKLMAKLPILHLEELNPTLFMLIEELNETKLLRQRLLLMKKYLTSCKAALETHLLWQLEARIHLIENEDRYSLQDLVDVHSGELLPYLKKLANSFTTHIKQDCKVCYGRGYCCEICKKSDVIFPFDTNVICCCQCQSAYHFPCWVKANQICPKCSRLHSRQLRSNSVNEESSNS